MKKLLQSVVSRCDIAINVACLGVSTYAVIFESAKANPLPVSRNVKARQGLVSRFWTRLDGLSDGIATNGWRYGYVSPTTSPSNYYKTL
jgi:hypothetical protein